MLSEKLKTLLTSADKESRDLGLSLSKGQDSNFYLFLMNCSLTVHNTKEVTKEKMHFLFDIYEKIIEPKKLFYGNLAYIDCFENSKGIVSYYDIVVSKVHHFNVNNLSLIVSLFYTTDNGEIKVIKINSSFIKKND